MKLSTDSIPSGLVLFPIVQIKQVLLKKSLFILCFFLSLTGCGYHFSSGGEKMVISVPFIKGDSDGRFTNEVVNALSASGFFDCQNGQTPLQLFLSITSNTDDRIGYRYDRDPTTGKRRKNIVGIENRESLTVEMKLVNTHTDEVVVGPELISATADYDYVDSNSIRDLTFTNSQGKTQTVIDFSLGQLDSIEGAHDDAQLSLFQRIALQIVDGLTAHYQVEREK